MKSSDNETEIERQALAIAVWDNEGGAQGQNAMDRHYGRRIEADRSWSVYHVFTGEPVDVEGHAMTGLSRSDATKNMLSLNRRNEGRRRERSRVIARATSAVETDDLRP